MNCKVCNTRLVAGAAACPNCGTDAPSGAAFAPDESHPGPLPAADASRARDPEEEVDVVELDELSQPDVSNEPRTVTGRPASRGDTGSARPRGASPSAGATASPRASSSAKATASGPGTPLFAPDPGGLRALLAEDPGVLEPGLAVYCDAEGTPLGAGYASGVGDIDLLATDRKGGLVVVMVSEKDQGEELVSEVLQRIGWVRKHVGEGQKHVRGIVLCEEPSESLGYAASAVADTVRFKTYRVALTFQDLEL